MKKSILLLLSIIYIIPAFADERDRAIIASTVDDRLQLEVLSRVGYGFHIVKTPDFKPAVSGEFFFNVMQLDVFPHPNLGLSLGVDCAFNRFTSKSAEFYLDSDHRVQALDLREYPVPVGSKHRGGFKHFSFHVPLMVRGIVGDLKVSAGGELGVNLPGTAYYSHTIDNRTNRVSETKAKLNTCSFAIVTSITYCDMGFFAKFYPKATSILPAGSVSMSYWTIGFIYGM
jgi:hypothetical protein